LIHRLLIVPAWGLLGALTVLAWLVDSVLISLDYLVFDRDARQG
jgi:hypothetical protein